MATCASIRSVSCSKIYKMDVSAFISSCILCVMCITLSICVLQSAHLPPSSRLGLTPQTTPHMGNTFFLLLEYLVCFLEKYPPIFNAFFVRGKNGVCCLVDFSSKTITPTISPIFLNGTIPASVTT